MGKICAPLVLGREAQALGRNDSPKHYAKANASVGCSVKNTVSDANA